MHDKNPTYLGKVFKERTLKKHKVENSWGINVHLFIANLSASPVEGHLRCATEAHRETTSPLFFINAQRYLSVSPAQSSLRLNESAHLCTAQAHSAQSCLSFPGKSASMKSWGRLFDKVWPLCFGKIKIYKKFLRFSKENKGK